MFTLNIMSTLTGEYFNRNDLTNLYLEEFSNDYPFKDNVVLLIEFAAQKLLKVKLTKKSYWYTKANSFTLLTLFAKHQEEIALVNEKLIKQRLEEFENNLPGAYQIAAKEGVNNRKERLVRYNYLLKVLLQ